MLERTSLVGGRTLDHSVLTSPFPWCSQCLKPEDVAEAVIYVLSTPPHVQVSLALAGCPLEEPSQPRGGEWEGLKEKEIRRLGIWGGIVLYESLSKTQEGRG